ncbi:MAG: DUF1592 domain-containing protein [Acidobacteriota bacterium]|nr:DUF1592 domain-containing protein [Acidobacteriota bacterium]
MFRRLTPAFIVFAGLPAFAASQAQLDREFTQTVRPFLNKYCVGCHSGKLPAASLDFKAYTTMDSVIRDYPRWSIVVNRLTAKTMPPKPVPPPPDQARLQVIKWIETARADEIKRNAGDPGPVLARRLTNAEYNYTVRDLTGVDIEPTKEFPIDPENQAGFDNSGEALTMSGPLLKKYLQAAREVSDHMVLTPDGFNFSQWPALVETDREKYAIERIIAFYKSQPTDYADYFEAAWRYRNRAALGQPKATLTSVAAEAKISPKYLPAVWNLLEEPAAQAQQEVGPIAKLQKMWNDLPAPAGAKEPDAVRTQCAAMRDLVVKIRNLTAMQFKAPVVRGLPAGSQPLLNWKLKEFNEHRRDSDPAALVNDTDPPLQKETVPRYAGLHQEAAPRWAVLMHNARVGEKDLVVPHDQRPKYEASFERFAKVFPDTFYVTERGRYFPDDSQDKGRLLSAGYHSVVGYWRDDQPLMELVLDDKGRQEIDKLWTEFDYIADYTSRTWTQYFFNQCGEVYGHGAESSCDRPDGMPVNDARVIFGKRDDYLKKANADPKHDPAAIDAINWHFDRMNTMIRNVEKLRAEAEPKHLAALVAFAGKAYRRPLTQAEKDDILAYYRKLRDKDKLSEDDAIRDSLVSILMSPDFCYRIDLYDKPAKGGHIKTSAGRPLPPYDLASRLSYFLWSSTPDEELLRHAAADDLRKPDVLLSETRRMLKDPRSAGLATEFGGQWLDFRQFETWSSVDRQRFPAFTNDLREAMFEEPVHFIADALQTDRPVLDLVYGKYTFVNPVLAKYYGIPWPKSEKEDAGNWVRIDDADKYGRGGILPMGAFLVQNSPGLRTSPVKRGYWVIHRVLGETIPPPPPNVPELPSDESKIEKPLRQMLAQHRANPVCAACHSRFDSFGLSFEGYGPAGEARAKDLGGRPVDAKVDYPGGGTGDGFDGLKQFIQQHRQDEFVDSITRKLLAFALGRTLIISDEPLVQQMKTRLASSGYKIDSLVETVVVSPQFLNRRAIDTRPVSSNPLPTEARKSVPNRDRKGAAVNTTKGDD